MFYFNTINNFTLWYCSKGIEELENNLQVIQIIKDLSNSYEVSEYFIRECVKGNKKSLTEDEIKKKYNQLNNPKYSFLFTLDFVLC